MPTSPEIPDKPYFKIGEVARLAGVEPYVLRYWETEFRAAIRPEKTRTKQRMYRRRDVEAILRVKQLLYEQGYRIDGAKRKLRELAGEAPTVELVRVVDEIRALLDAVDQMLDEDEAS
jgi:DNA-binding transcriptional MerR regulator